VKKSVLFLVGVLVFSLIGSCIPVNAEPSQEAGKAASGRILFVDTTEQSQGKTYLATINPDGTGKNRLTPAYNNIVFPRMSEASGWMGFTNKLPDMRSEVYLLSRDGQKVKKILDGAALEGFSPDGKYVLYTTCDRDASLFAYSIESKQATKLSQDLKITAADWSPNKEWIAVSALAANGNSDMYLISTLAQGIVRLTDTMEINESFPVFTHDGKKLAFISNRNGANEIEFMDLEKKEATRPMIQGMYPSVSIDDLWVTFQSGENIGISRVNGLEIKSLGTGRTPSWIK